MIRSQGAASATARRSFAGARTKHPSNAHSSNWNAREVLRASVAHGPWLSKAGPNKLGLDCYSCEGLARKVDAAANFLL